MNTGDYKQLLYRYLRQVATLLGTLAAIGLSNPLMPFQRIMMMLSPIIVHLIITAAGMSFFYTQLGLSGSYLRGYWHTLRWYALRHYHR